MNGNLSRLIPSISITIICLLSQLLSRHCISDENTDMISHLLYVFNHANIFHFAVNIWALFQFKPRVKTCVIGYISSVLAGMAPFSMMNLPTCGLSGFLMACYARRYYSHKLSFKTLLIVNLALAFVPVFNWKIHLWSFFIAYTIYGTLHLISIYRRG